MNKIYIAISTQDQENNINELTSVHESFDGICAIDHFSKDKTYEILKNRCANGFVEQIPFYGHHAHDLNHILFNPIIKIGDWILLRDSSERINPQFAFNIRPFINYLNNHSINTVYQRSKLLLFKRFPQQFFSSTPHWGFIGGRDSNIDISQTSLFNNDEEYCYSVRNQREKLSWVNHYLRYYLYNDSNHNLLGANHFGDAKEIFIQKEQKRLAFLLYLQKLGINNDKDSLINYWRNNPLTPEMRLFVDNVRILNDAYLYNILGDADLTDDIVRPCKQIT